MCPGYYCPNAGTRVFHSPRRGRMYLCGSHYIEAQRSLARQQECCVVM